MSVSTAPMSTRSRRRSPPTEAETYDDEFSFVTDADIDVFVAEQEIEEELDDDKKQSEGFLNLQTGAGLGLIGVGGLYAMQVAGFLTLETGLLYELVQVLPILASVLIMLTGFGVLSWSPAARRRRQARARAARLRQRQKKTMGRGTSSRGAGARSRTEEVGKASRNALENAERIARRSARAASDTASTAYASAKANRRKNYRLAKDRSRKKITGVAAGIADYFGLEPTLVRIAFVLAAIFGQGAGVLLYLILTMALPYGQEGEDRRDDKRDRKRGRKGSHSRRRRDDDDDDDREFYIEDD